ncbi:MAG: hypothetical protein C0490_27095 [Marivirga sp.]|nr:hypothetical protein [Marivirga sp.]
MWEIQNKFEIMEITSAALFISMSLAVFGISYYYFTTRHKERMTLLDKGLPSDFFTDTNNYLHLILLLGIVSIGISIGLGTAAWIRSLEIEGIGGIAFPLMIFLFLGLSLIVSYFVLRALQKKP